VPGSIDRTGAPRPVVLLDPDVRRRDAVANTLRAAGMRVLVFGAIAEMDCWPSGAVLVTDVSYYTPWWKSVGVSDVIVISPTPDAGRAACADGACDWVPERWTPAAVLQVIQRACSPSPSRDPIMRLANGSAQTSFTTPVASRLRLFWAPFIH
jgi:hypothetical protein